MYMRPRHFSFRFGKIKATVWFYERLEKDRKYRFMIFCHGLPGHPYQFNPAKIECLIKRGFVLVFPDYIGTWASYGNMSWENCVATILQTIAWLKKGEGRELRDNTKVGWGLKDIILVGSSFGGSIALVAGAKSDDIQKIISFAAPIDYRSHSKIKGEDEPIEDLYEVVVREAGALWRIADKGEWRRLVRGDADINPIDYVEFLKNKDVFLVHGDKDRVVSVKRSDNLFRSLRTGKGTHKILILKGEKHIGYDSICQKNLMPKILRWLG